MIHPLAALVASPDLHHPHLTLIDRAVLGLLCSSHPGGSVKDLALALNQSKPAIVRALDKLVSHRLAMRHEHPVDRRLVCIHPTPLGRETDDRTMAVMQQACVP